MTEIHIVKQIDNSRLVKEVDYEQTKECLLLMVLGMLCLVALLFLAWQQFEVVRRGYEREELRTEIQHLAEVNRQLKLERATLRSPQRIDLIAREKLGLMSPSFHQVVVLSEFISSRPKEILVASRENLGTKSGAPNPGHYPE